jgi:hypothetical protein
VEKNMNFNDWEYLYNWNGTHWHRANLVYTPYISPDKKTLCMSFNRDLNYHSDPEENELWTDSLLQERFARELNFYFMAKKAGIPTLYLQSFNALSRHIFFHWTGADFYTQGFDVLPNWQGQWLQRINEMWSAGIYKFSLHPNSWVVREGTLVPFNWFFCFGKDESVVIKDYLIQISNERQEKMEEFLKSLNLDLYKPYDPLQLQTLAFLSFKSNYPNELIEQVIKNHDILRQNN